MRLNKATRITHETMADLCRAHVPVLVACMLKDQKLQDQLITLEYIAGQFTDSLAVYYALEDMFPYFSEKYSIKGTPTFLILDKGKCMGCILGITSNCDLMEKVNSILLGHACPAKTAGADHLHYENDPPDSMDEKNKVETPDEVLKKQVVE
jgi:hypothetical protein